MFSCRRFSDFSDVFLPQPVILRLPSHTHCSYMFPSICTPSPLRHTHTMLLCHRFKLLSILCCLYNPPLFPPLHTIASVCICIVWNTYTLTAYLPSFHSVITVIFCCLLRCSFCSDSHFQDSPLILRVS